MIVLTVIVCIVYGILHIEGDFHPKIVPVIDTTTYTDAIGFSVYAYEGIGLILPVREIVQNDKDYRKIVQAVILTCAILYISFGYFCIIAWEEDINSPLITDQLPKTWDVWVIKILFAINLVFSYPL